MVFSESLAKHFDYPKYSEPRSCAPEHGKLLEHSFANANALCTATEHTTASATVESHGHRDFSEERNRHRVACGVPGWLNGSLVDLRRTAVCSMLLPYGDKTHGWLFFSLTLSDGLRHDWWNEQPLLLCAFRAGGCQERLMMQVHIWWGGRLAARGRWRHPASRSVGRHRSGQSASCRNPTLAG